jgi:hypothetical protein
MDESPTGCWTNHHSIISFKNQWYLFYHHNDYSPRFDKARSVRADSLSFNADGTIQKVIPTLRGIGLTAAGNEIQLDRYSKISETGASIDFLDTLNRFKGWFTELSSPGAWVQYNSVDFGNKKLTSVQVNASSAGGSVIQVHLNDSKGPVIAEIKIPAGANWQLVKAPLMHAKPGVQNLVVTHSDGKPVLIDWIRFE